MDAAHFEQVVQAAIDQAVQKQAEAGVGIMSDGELGKVGYATYITQRLGGFGGHVYRTPARSLTCGRLALHISDAASWQRRAVS